MIRTFKKCKGCGDDITGFPTDGYCENCLCVECATPLVTETERALGFCEDCENSSLADESSSVLGDG